MMSSIAIRLRDRWKVRGIVFAALITPVYLLPSVARMLLPGNIGWISGLLIGYAIICLAITVTINNLRAAIGVCAVSAMLELALVAAGCERATALWIGGVFPAVVLIYFAQQLYINMGE
jgi:hypothetical protein